MSNNTAISPHVPIYSGMFVLSTRTLKAWLAQEKQYFLLVLLCDSINLIDQPRENGHCRLLHRPAGEGGLSLYLSETTSVPLARISKYSFHEFSTFLGKPLPNNLYLFCGQHKWDFLFPYISQSVSLPTRRPVSDVYSFAQVQLTRRKMYHVHYVLTNLCQDTGHFQYSATSPCPPSGVIKATDFYILIW